jgi:hypothetical protein
MAHATVLWVMYRSAVALVRSRISNTLVSEALPAAFSAAFARLSRAPVSLA